MAFQLYDTLLAKKVPLTTREEGHVRMYVCGPTTYDDAHIGHARPCVTYDVLVRHLRSQGLRVTYVRNVTDIDDKIIKRAAENAETPTALAARMYESYVRDMAALHTLEPDHEPKVSDHLDDIVGLISRLIERGHAYESQGDVYFEVATDADYGKLSHRDLSQLEAGASERVEAVEAERKRHAYDFALWKGAKAGEPSWASPFGPGRPGWHIECSAMSMRYLGESFDLHGGGLDLVFPHHENELAQSECATGQCFSRHWMHNGFVQVNREKMSKSLGNFFRLRESFERVEPEAVRYALLTAHYRAPYNLEVDLDEAGHILGFPQFSEAEARLEYLYTTVRRLAELPEARIAPGADTSPSEVREFRARLAESLDDDLNTAQALGHVAGLLKATNEMLDRALGKKGSLPSESHTLLRASFERLSSVLGIGLDEPSQFLRRVRDRRAKELNLSEDWIAERLAARHAARAEKDFARADAVRAELLARGVELLDSPGGTDWRLVKLS